MESVTDTPSQNEPEGYAKCFVIDRWCKGWEMVVCRIWCQVAKLPTTSPWHSEDDLLGVRVPRYIPKIFSVSTDYFQGGSIQCSWQVNWKTLLLRFFVKMRPSDISRYFFRSMGNTREKPKNFPHLRNIQSRMDFIIWMFALHPNLYKAEKKCLPISNQR